MVPKRCLPWAAMAALALLCLVLIPACRNKAPVKVGFVGTLSGRGADLGSDCRDGALLAVEEANSDGGVNGRPVELVMRDDQEDPSEALKADAELVNAGCKVIVGHMTSNMVEAVMPWLNKTQVAMVSPTVSSELFSGRKDNFYRTFVSSAKLAKVQASYLVKNLGCRTAAAAYDDANRAHSKVWVDAFQRELEALGGRVLNTVVFNGQKGADYRAICRQVVAGRPDCVLVIANVLDTAMICQHLRAAGSKARITTSEWSATKDLWRLGGRCIDGLLIVSCHQYDSKVLSYVSFRERFSNRFGRQPTGLSAHGYNAMQVAIQAIKLAAEQNKTVNEVLRQPRTYPGVHGDIALDEYGEVDSKVYIGEIDGTQIRTVYIG